MILDMYIVTINTFLTWEWKDIFWFYNLRINCVVIKQFDSVFVKIY